MSPNVFDVLQARGFLAQVTDESEVRQLLEQETVTFYTGYDPTADSLHVGNLVTVMAMMHLQQAGHRPIALVGGGTSMIGDPSGRTELRQMMTLETIEANSQKLKSQLDHYLNISSGEAIFENNAAWLRQLNYIEFLRDIGRHFSVNRMLSFEAYRQRLERGLNFIEFNYQLLQAYDFLVLYQKYGCNFQMGGDDQWGNLVAGVDLIRRVEGATVHALTYPLLTTASGAKMGKTASGAVWLSAEKFSPYDFYQYFINCDDRDVEKLLKIFTFLPLDEIARLVALQGAEIREAKRQLAFEATKITHGQTEAAAAEQAAKAAFASGGNLEAMPTTVIDPARLEAGVGVLEIFAEVGLNKSRSEARRMLQQGGIYVNDQRIESEDANITLQDLGSEGIMLRAGKKRHHRLITE